MVNSSAESNFDEIDFAVKGEGAANKNKQKELERSCN